MRECECELVRVIRESADPTKTMTMATDIMQRLIAGEDEQSIAASYGIKLEEETSATIITEEEDTAEYTII